MGLLSVPFYRGQHFFRKSLGLMDLSPILVVGYCVKIGNLVIPTFGCVFPWRRMTIE